MNATSLRWSRRRTRTIRTRALPLLAVAALVGAACGGDDDAAATTGAAATETTGATAMTRRPGEHPNDRRLGPLRMSASPSPGRAFRRQRLLVATPTSSGR